MGSRKAGDKKRSPAPNARTVVAEPLKESRAAVFGRSPIAFVIASVLVLIPCFWQSRIQAGDLSSHIYNAWLAQLVERGHAPGLTIATPTTNVLFDLILGGLFKMFGAAAAQRIAVSICVLVFAWGAFALVSKAAQRRAWALLPAVAVLAYGWVFHMGLFNFYLSLGLCFWALALAWEPSVGRLVGAGALLAIAYLAHGLPVAWTVCVAAYAWALRRVPETSRIRVLAAAAGIIVVARVVIGALMDARWSTQQLTMVTGLDQAEVFDEKYWLIYIGLLVIWASMAVDVVRRSRFKNVIASVPFQVCVLTAAGVAIFPDWLLIPGYKHALAFIAQRMSLALAISICVWIATAPVRAWQRWSMVGVALLFFGFLYQDEALLNGLEDRMQEAVSQVPTGQRVIGGIEDPDLRVTPVTHMIDRVCLGHCYSYANYEPSTAQFRVRAAGPNPIVVSSYDDSWQMQMGVYVVQPRDLPLYQVVLDQTQTVRVRALQADVQSGMSYWKF